MVLQTTTRRNQNNTMKSSTAHALSPDQDNSDVLATLTDIANAALEAKAADIKVLDVRQLSDVSNYVLIMSGNSDRQVQGITNRILRQCKDASIEVTSVEGLEKAHWVIIDCSDILIHVFYLPARQHYDLEGLWMEALPIRVSKPNRKGLIRIG